MTKVEKTKRGGACSPWKKSLKKKTKKGLRLRPDRPAGYPAHTAPYTMKTGPIEVFLDAESDFWYPGVEFLVQIVVYIKKTEILYKQMKKTTFKEKQPAAAPTYPGKKAFQKKR